METHNHTGYTSDRMSPARKHTFTQEDIKLCESRAWKHTITQDIQATVGVQHGNTHSHKRIYTSSVGSSINTIGYTSSVRVEHETHNHTGYTSDRGSPAWKHTFTQENIYKLCGGPALTQ